MEEVYVDAENRIAGRTASLAAKELMKGRKVSIVNAEKAVISGDNKYTISFFKQRIDRGDPYHGPFYPKRPDMVLKRMVRGMIPYKKPMGRTAFKQLRVYLSVPEEFKGKEFKTGKPVPPNQKGMTLQKLSERL